MRFAVLVVFLLLLQVASVSAVSAVQKEINPTVEAGREYTFNTILQNPSSSTEEITLQTSGDAAAWVRYGSEKSEDYPVFLSPYSTVFVPVTIIVPGSAETGVVSAKIKGDDTVLADLSIRVVPNIADIIIMQEKASFDIRLDNLSAEFSSISGGIVSEIASGNQDIAGKLEILNSIQNSINELKNQQTNLADDISTVNSGLTGGVTASASAAGFVVGLVVAVIGIYLFSGKRKLSFPKKRSSEGYGFSPQK